MTMVAVAQRRLDRILSRLMAAPLWVFLSVVVLVTLLRAGTWEMPNMPVQALLLRNPFQNPYGSQDVYLWWNWLSPCIAHFLGIRTVHSYYIFCLVLAAAVLPLAYSTFRRSLPGPESRWRLLLLTCMPVAFIAFYWVGMDSLTILLLLLIVRSVESPFLAGCYGLLIGMQHAEQAGLAITLYAVTRWLLVRERHTLRGPIAALVGLVIGRCLLQVIAAHASRSPSLGRVSYFADHHTQILESFFTYFPFTVLASFGVGWLIWLRSSLSRDDWKILAIVLVVGVGIGLTVMDKTRVGAIVTLPSVMALLSTPRFDLSRVRERLVPAIGLAMIVPVVVVWQAIFTSVLPWDVLYLAHAVSGHPMIGSIFSIWPFAS